MVNETINLASLVEVIVHVHRYDIIHRLVPLSIMHQQPILNYGIKSSLPPLNARRPHTMEALSPGLLRGRGKEGLVSTACTYAVIIQILNNPITYRYCPVYLPFDLIASCSTYLEMAGLDSSNFERDFKVARVMFSIDR